MHGIEGGAVEIDRHGPHFDDVLFLPALTIRLVDRYENASALPIEFGERVPTFGKRPLQDARQLGIAPLLVVVECLERECFRVGIQPVKKSYGLGKVDIAIVFLFRSDALLHHFVFMQVSRTRSLLFTACERHRD